MDAVALIRLALNVITERLIAITSLIMAFVLAIWIMQTGTWQQVLTLFIFVVFSYLLTKREGNERKNQAPKTE